MSTPEGAGTQTPSSVRSGEQPGRYVLLLELAAGGMGSVYVGRLRGAAGFERLVAIKRMHQQIMADRDLVLSFHEEARIASLVHHPNVVQVLDVYEENNEHMLVMEYVDGVSLSVLAKAARKVRTRVPLLVAVRIAIEAARGLHAAHETRDLDGRPLCVVHRDVSPHNILVAANGAVRVTDFGIAHAILRAVQTERGELKGKVRYMSPEQAECRPLDRRADIFSLGIVLWELITGEPLYNGLDTLSNLQLATAAHVDPPSSRLAEVPPELDAIILRALARDPAERFPTAEAFANELESWAVAARSLATPADVAATVDDLAGGVLLARQRDLQRFLTVRSGDAWPKPPPVAPADATPATSVGSIGTVQPPADRGRGALKLVALLGAAGVAVVGGVALLVRFVGSPAQPPASATAKRPSSSAVDLVAPPPLAPSASASERAVASASAQASARPLPTGKPPPPPPAIELRDNPYE